jgi:DNA polymerase-3 subunit epsilon
MSEFADFIGDSNLLAHNASFDKRFLDSELEYINRSYAGAFTCSLLVSRRIYPDAINHQLGTLIDYCSIESTGDFHRALYDSEMTAKLWLAILNDIDARHTLPTISFEAIQKLTKTPKKKVEDYLNKLSVKVSQT